VRQLVYYTASLAFSQELFSIFSNLFYFLTFRTHNSEQFAVHSPWTFIIAETTADGNPFFYFFHLFPLCRYHCKAVKIPAFIALLHHEKSQACDIRYMPQT